GVPMAENGDRTTASAACDLRSVKSLPRPGFTRKLDDSIGGGRTQSAGRVTRVRLIHQLARQFHSLLIDLSMKQIRKKKHAVMLINRMRRRDAHGIATFGSYTGDRVSCAFVARQELSPFDPLRQMRSVMLLEFRWRDVSQVTAPARIVDPRRLA